MNNIQTIIELTQYLDSTKTLDKIEVILSILIAIILIIALYCMYNFKNIKLKYTRIVVIMSIVVVILWLINWFISFKNLQKWQEYCTKYTILQNHDIRKKDQNKLCKELLQKKIEELQNTEEEVEEENESETITE